MRPMRRVLPKLCLSCLLLLTLAACGGGAAPEPTLMVFNAEPTTVILTTPEPTPPPEPTATVYVPEGQLLYENFEGLADDYESELDEGVIRRKAQYGIEIEVSIDTHYFLLSGLGDVNDANLTTYALPVTVPERTTAIMACRIVDGGRETYGKDHFQGYVAYFRFDGAYSLEKRILGAPNVNLVPWQTGASLNDPGVFNNLYLLCDGPRILFIVNGQVLFDVQDEEFTRGDFGFGVATPGEGNTSIINFDKFSLFEP